MNLLLLLVGHTACACLYLPSQVMPTLKVVVVLAIYHCARPLRACVGRGEGGRERERGLEMCLLRSWCSPPSKKGGGTQT